MSPSKPKGKSHIVFQLSQEGCLLLDQKNDQIHSLNPAAAFIWVFCDGKHTIQEIEIAFLEHAHLSAEKAGREVETTLRNFRTLGLLE